MNWYVNWCHVCELIIKSGKIKYISITGKFQKKSTKKMYACGILKEASDQMTGQTVFSLAVLGTFFTIIQWNGL